MSDNTESSAYFYRIITLVVDIGTVTLRDLFYSRCPKESVLTFFQNPKIQAEFTSLKSKKALTNVQYQRVTINPDPDTYDISLLITLLTSKKICGITPPATGWGKCPPDTDPSLGADLVRIRDVRNEIVGHRTNAQLEETEFQRYWGKVETLLVRIASHVNSAEKTKIKQMVDNAKTRVLQPLDDREKGLLQVFMQWQKEDQEKYQSQLSDMQNSLDRLHLKVDSRQGTDETDAVRADDSLSSLQSEVNSLAQNICNLAQQGAVHEIHENVQSIQGVMDAMKQTIQSLKKQLDDNQSQMNSLMQQIQAAGNHPPNFVFERGDQHSRQFVPKGPKKPKVTNPHAMSNKEIHDLSKRIGYEWEPLRIHLDFTEAQAHALKRAYDDDVQVRIYHMLKEWHDVVVDCGENPRMLLAAAFVSAATNYAMAYSLVPKEQFKKNAEAKPSTVELIQEIRFRKSGYDQGDGVYRAGSGYSMPPGGPGSFNMYDSDLQIEGYVAIHSGPSSQLYNSHSDSLDGRWGGGSMERPQSAQTGSLNVYGGNVVVKPGSNLVIGAPAAGYYPQNNNQSIARGETEIVPDSVAPCSTLSGSLSSSGQPFKKEHDDTLRQSMVAALHEQMKSVGVLISGGNVIGTVFRVGNKCVMTAFHVIQAIIDPSGSGCVDVSRLESQDTFINFNESPLVPPVVLYKVRKEFIGNRDLDVAVLEITNPSNLPKKMNLRMSTFGVTNVSLIGYGHPGQAQKCLDPKCQIVPPDCPRIRSALAWLHQKSDYYRSAMKEMGRNPSLVDKGYQGYDHPSKIIFDCYMEHGASGAPALTNDNERSIEVVGLLTHGLPELYYNLPDFMKKDFPNGYRLETGTKMQDVFRWIEAEQPGVVQDIFN